MVFDTCQPHAVIARHSSIFNTADFPVGQDCTQVFLTWELSVENAGVAQALQIVFDIDPLTASQLGEAQVRVNGEGASVCARTGRWGKVG
jgi:hypothetical protein